MFQLTLEEDRKLRSQIVTTKHTSMTRTLPYVFTEQGVAMLATVLKTSVDDDISIQIMDDFVSMRKYISSSLVEQKYINELVVKNSKRIDVLEKTFSGFRDKTNHLFF